MHASRSFARRSSSTVEAAGSSGFTLLELLLALTLAAIISLCISSVSNQAQKIYQTTTSKVEVYQKFRYALDAMERSIQGWTPTTSLEFYIDQQQAAQGGLKNGHWDDGEEVAVKGPNTDGGIYGDYDEGAKIFERKYTLQQGPNTTEHDAFSIYFRAPVEVDGAIRLANIEYLLADPREIDGDRIAPIPAVVDENANFVLLRVVRYLNVDGSNYDRSSVEVAQKISEICSNVTDLRIEYFYDNIFDQKPGAFVVPSTERQLVDSERFPDELDGGIWVKEFLYGGFRDFSKAVAYPGRREVENSVDERPYFQVPTGAVDNRFSQLELGDPIFIWAEGNSQFPRGEKTIARNDNGKLYFREVFDTADWTGNQTGLRFRAAYAPSAVRVSIRVLNDQGKEPRTLTITVHPHH